MSPKFVLFFVLRFLMSGDKTMYSPAMRYVLPCLAIDEEELGPVQTQVISAMLQKTRLLVKTSNCNMLRLRGTRRTRSLGPPNRARNLNSEIHEKRDILQHRGGKTLAAQRQILPNRVGNVGADP